MDFQKELIAEFGRETGKTRKMLEAIPADADFSFQPHPKSMTLGVLVDHLAGIAGPWAVGGLTTDKLVLPADHKPEHKPIESKAALLAQYDKQVAETKAVLAKFEPAKWEDNWKFLVGEHTIFDSTKFELFREGVINHLVHHRAQLGVYLRLMDKPLPGTYGPSADGM
jgi:uncharacterized damage-inducible protein DinB